MKGNKCLNNAGRHRGRARGIAKKRDLNKGQIIGMGKILIQFPGLNTPVFRGIELVQQQKLPVDPVGKQKLMELRQSQTRSMQVKLAPLERSWTSTTMDGRKIRPSDPV